MEERHTCCRLRAIIVGCENCAEGFAGCQASGDAVITIEFPEKDLQEIQRDVIIW